MDSRRPIGVFDSGVGGLSILQALRIELPQENFVYFSDSGHAPYGEKLDAFVARRSLAVAHRLIGDHRVKALVVACNTATAASIDLLRANLDRLPVIGVEPALKPAATASRTRRIAVFATRSTLSSRKFQALRKAVEHLAEFVLVPCDGLAAAIERDNLDEVGSLCGRYGSMAGEFGNRPGCIDTLVLGCTHYVFALGELRRAAGEEVRILETGGPVALQTRRVLHRYDLLNGDGCSQVELVTTGAASVLSTAAQRWLKVGREALRTEAEGTRSAAPFRSTVTFPGSVRGS